MRIFVDVDQTICHGATGGDYGTAKPIEKNIAMINELYDEGHHITYYTARGSGNGRDWRFVTEKSFQEWGAKYHELILKKPIYDCFIDDRVINARDWENEGNSIIERYVKLNKEKFNNPDADCHPSEV